MAQGQDWAPVSYHWRLCYHSCSVILSPTPPPSDALPRANSPALSLKRNTCSNSGSWHNEEQDSSESMPWGGGGPRLGTLGPHKAHETAVPSKAFEEGKQAPLFWGTPPPTPQPGWDGCLTRLVSLPSNRRPLALAGFTWNFLQPASSKGSLLLCTEALRLEEEKEYKARNWGVSEDNSPNKKQKNASIKDPWFL